MITLFDPLTWKNTRCNHVCEQLNVSEALRYRHPQQCYTHNIKHLLAARVHHVSQEVLLQCTKTDITNCPFQGNLLKSYPSNVKKSNIRKTYTLQHKSCAVVGSGKGASGFGDRIDRHDAVIRTNDAPTNSIYSVGTKTTYRITHCWPINDISLKMCNVDDHWTSIWIGNYDSRHIGNRSHWKISKNNSFCEAYKGWGHCSTGLWAVTFAMTHCDEIHLYGFMPSKVNNSWQYTRYYHTLQNTKREAAHNYIKEKSKLYSLHCAGRLRVYS